MIWRWLTVAGLSMTPALIAGRWAAATAGVGWRLNPWGVIVVMAISSFINSFIVMWLSDLSVRVGFIKRLLKRFHTEKALKWCEKWGAWGGLTLGVAFVGPIPILVTLKWMKVATRQLLLPVAVSSLLYSFIWYGVVYFGFDQVLKMETELKELKELWNLL